MGAEQLLGQASHILAGADGSRAGQLHQQLTATVEQLDHVAQFGLLPLCLGLLVLHENYRAATEGAPFRVTYVLGRTAAVVALVLSYGRVCALITGVAGAGGGWMAGDQFISDFASSYSALGGAWKNTVGTGFWSSNLENVPQFIVLLVGWLIFLCAALLAYIAGLFLSLSQAALLAVILAVGKTCIVVSLVPGVGIGKSWARALAATAAWSTIAGIITSLLVYQGKGVAGLLEAGDLLGLLKAAAQFVILAVCTLSVPMITGRIMAGAAPAAAGALGAVMMGVAGAKMIAAGAVRGAGAHLGTGGSNRAVEGAARNHRPHKVPMASDASASRRA